MGFEPRANAKPGRPGLAIDEIFAGMSRPLGCRLVARAIITKRRSVAALMLKRSRSDIASAIAR